MFDQGINQDFGFENSIMGNNNVINNIKTLIIINIMLNSIMCVLIYLLKHVSTTNNEQQQ